MSIPYFEESIPSSAHNVLIIGVDSYPAFLMMMRVPACDLYPCFWIIDADFTIFEGRRNKCAITAPRHTATFAIHFERIRLGRAFHGAPQAQGAVIGDTYKQFVVGTERDPFD